MIVAITIKAALIVLGIIFAILSLVSLSNRITTPSFATIWVVIGILLIFGGIFIEPYRWSSIVGIPTLIILGLCLITFLLLFWYLTKKINILSKKFNENVIQLTLLNDQIQKLQSANNSLTAEIQNVKASLEEPEINIEPNKKVLFVINTLGVGGAEISMFNLMKLYLKKNCDVHLFVITNQGNLLKKVPEGVKLLNEHFNEQSVHTDAGKMQLTKTVLASQKRDATGIKLFGYQLTALTEMLFNGKVYLEKLAWRSLSQTAPLVNFEYDVAIAGVEGAATYYVAERVIAKHKIAYVQVAYSQSGYTRHLDKSAYDSIDEIRAVSEETRQEFLRVHPECNNKTIVYENIIDYDEIFSFSQQGKFNRDSRFTIISVGRLTKQKSFEVSIKAAKLLKDKGIDFVWYFLGEGPERNKLQQLIDELNVGDEVLLIGNVDNPYPYMYGCDVMVHASKFEGKSVAVREAKSLGAAIIVSDVKGNREQIINEEDGIICKFSPESIANSIIKLKNDKKLFNKIKKNARDNEISKKR